MMHTAAAQLARLAAGAAYSTAAYSACHVLACARQRCGWMEYQLGDLCACDLATVSWSNAPSFSQATPITHRSIHLHVPRTVS